MHGDGRVDEIETPELLRTPASSSDTCTDASPDPALIPVPATDTERSHYGSSREFFIGTPVDSVRGADIPHSPPAGSARGAETSPETHTPERPVTVSDRYGTPHPVFDQGSLPVMSERQRREWGERLIRIEEDLSLIHI